MPTTGTDNKDSKRKKTPTTFTIVDGQRVGHGHAGTTVGDERHETPFDFPACRREDVTPEYWTFHRAYFASDKAALNALYKGAEYKIGNSQGGKTRDKFVAPTSEATIQKMLAMKIAEYAGQGVDCKDFAVAFAAAGDDRNALVELWKVHIRKGEQVKPEDDGE